MASISCQHIYKIYPGATAPSVTDFNLEIQDRENQDESDKAVL